jgi:2-methylcitrate dehydratase PrpD
MATASAGLSDRLCRHIAEMPTEALPLATREAACRAILDATGVMLAASGLSPDIAPFIDLARAGGVGPCAIIGVGAKASAPMAAFANGAMGHALDFEDAFDPAPCHPNVSAIPAAIAIAQAFGPVSGAEFIAAIAIGCDLVCRMGLSLRQTMEESGWYPPPILGAFGATAAAARLARLTAGQTRDALSLTLCQATAPGEIKHSEGAVIRAVREAFPAQAAVISALLARSGVAGFETPFEGEGGFFRLYADGRYDPADLLDGLGERFHIDRLSFKPWPACRGTHAYIELALQARTRPGFDWRSIEAITAVTGSVQRMLIEPLARKRAPATAIDAKFSLPYTIALALIRGRATLDDFDDASLGDPAILELAGRVVARERPDWGRSMASAGGLAIRYRDGSVFEGELAEALGAPDRPIPPEGLVAKFVACAARAARPLDADAARALAGRLMTLGAAPDAGAIFDPD